MPAAIPRIVLAEHTLRLRRHPEPRLAVAKDRPDGSIAGFNWSFGDGNTSLAQNPFNTYDQPGNYTVELIVIDDDGGTGSATATINVIDPNSPPSVTLNANTGSGAAPLTINFTSTATDSDGTIQSYSWDFGDGYTSNTQNPSHTFSNPGTYNVTLEATDAQTE